MSWQLAEAKLIGLEFPEIVAELDESGPLEDMPWSDGPGQVASDRLRRLIEREAPGHAQFLPIRLVRNGGAVKLGQYWMTNWLHMVDCFDRDRSDYVEVMDKYEATGKRLSFNKLVINTAQVPPSILICRVKWYENVVIIRHGLRDILDAEGITGCQFYRIDQI